ncbi:helix-turn-helix transcriptional regulator [Saccharopolyspora rosea]|uniref:Helix-turn-helix transcriptional regulator n=1 Tax=Saccharopolyspora rosea TaxID=524884 RepID=A0ABW3G078_9PSEU|nr:helix-turn-helix transcriptional regulator [Saccharopolyspora rosea]
MHEAARRALGRFLRTRRERLTPEAVGLPRVGRRRTRGLRREEVAELSGVSVSWYTWLEQGRDINVSRQVLGAVAAALAMSASERRHLYLLAGELPPESGPARELGHLRDVVARLWPQPSCLRDAHWDLLDWNPAEAALFTDFAALPPHRRNMLWLMFGWRPMRRLLVDWEVHARHLLAQFHALADRKPTDTRFAEVVAGLRETDADFRCWWERYDVAAFEPVHREYRHPRVGALRLRTTKLLAAEDVDVQIITRAPADAESADRMRALTR